MHNVLLVVDMQNAFRDMVSSSLPNVITLIEHFRELHYTVIFTKHGHTDEDLTPPLTNQLVRKWGVDGSIRVGTESWQFLREIDEFVQEDVVRKNTYDAFLNTNLESILKTEGDVKRIVICGVMTDCCCDTTARSAFNRGYETWMVGDACGSRDEEQHQAGLKAWEFGYGPVVSTKDVLEKIRE
jgi:nicotinamidase-related amidase